MSTISRSSTARKQAIARRMPDPTQILRASLCTRFTQCGRPGCKCMRGEKHGPSYYVTVTVAAGKTRQLYVRAADVDAVRRWIDNYHAMWQAMEELSTINFEILRTLHPDRRTKPVPRRPRGRR